MAQCISCIHFTLRDHPGTNNEKSKMAAQSMAKRGGFGRCVIGPAWQFLSPEQDRECKRHEAAESSTTEQRRTWLAAR